ncbi:MAG: biopolymer transporter ExbD [Blastochloris sp.]|nr:biopolymer transporter ExbD [Blastochloris sp.]
MIPKRRAPENAKIQMTPMIDMTFLLLVFFMVTSKITKEQKKLEIKLPTAATAKQPDDLSGRDIINIDANGQLYTGDTPVDLSQLKRYLKQRLIDYPPLKISVRADGKTPAKQIKEVMRAAAEAGAVEVVFSAYNK